MVFFAMVFLDHCQKYYGVFAETGNVLCCNNG